MKTGGFSCGKREFITRSNTMRETKVELLVGRGRVAQGSNGQTSLRRSESWKAAGLRNRVQESRAQESRNQEPERTVNVDRKHCKDLTRERA